MTLHKMWIKVCIAVGIVVYVLGKIYDPSTETTIVFHELGALAVAVDLYIIGLVVYFLVREGLDLLTRLRK